MAQSSSWLSEGDALDGYAIKRRGREINTEPLKKAVKYYKPAWLRNQAAPAADQPAPVVQQPAPVVAEPHPAEFEPEYQSPFAAAPPVGSNLANWLGGNIVAVLQGQENHRNTN